MKESNLQLLYGWLYVVAGVIMLIAAWDLLWKAEDVLGLIATFSGGLALLVGTGELLERSNNRRKKNKGN